MMDSMINHFAQPLLLLLLPLPVLFLLWRLWRGVRPPTTLYSDLSITAGLPVSLRQRINSVFPWTRALALCLGIVALARPQYGTVEFDVNSLGLDIALVIDVSGSMQQQDFLPNRLEAAKAAAAQFVSGRQSDRVSVVVFGDQAAVLCPPTLDMGAVTMFINSIRDGIIRNNATAIGDGLGLAVSKLKDSPAKERVVILLTDGENNAGKLDPVQTGQIAAALNVKVHSISVGRVQGGRNNPGFDTSEIREISRVTGGLYFHASNEQALKKIYDEIDALEKVEIEVNETATYNERFMFFWFPALVLLALEFLLRGFWIGRLP